LPLRFRQWGKEYGASGGGELVAAVWLAVLRWIQADSVAAGNG